MGCCIAFCDPCCKRIGCGCRDHDAEPLASIEKKRSCTDLPCIALFIAFCVYLTVIVWMPAYEEGDYKRLVNGVNHEGKICGVDEGVKDYKYAFWPDPSEYRFKVCTADCNEATWTNFIGNNIQVNGINVGYQTEPYMDKYCLPSHNNTETISIAGFDDWSSTISRSMGDIETSLNIIGASVVIAFIMSFLFVWMMKVCVGVLVWSTIGFILTGGLLLGYTLYQSKDDANLSATDSDIREYGGYVVLGLTLIFLCIIIFARNRIRIAIQVIKSAGRSIGDMPMMVFFPILPLITLVGFFFAWLWTALYIFSAGDEVTNSTPTALQSHTYVADGTTSTGTYLVLDHDDTVRNQFAPHWFLLLWVVQIAVYFTFTVISGAVADWYFTARDEDGDKYRGNGEEELSNRAVCNACCRTTRYHVGTVIYAAAIIAIIKFIRHCVAYMEKGMRGESKFKKIFRAVVHCLLKCLECCLDKVSKNALIWCSIYGDAFCPSVCGSFKIIWGNLVRVAVITFFSTIVTTLGKIMIPLFTTGVCALILMNVSTFSDELGSPVAPIIVIFVISFAVASLFLTVYDTAIDTVFMCFLIDEKQNKANGQMFADEGLRNIVQKYEAQSKVLANKMKGNATDARVVKVRESDSDGEEVQI